MRFNRGRTGVADPGSVDPDPPDLIHIIVGDAYLSKRPKLALDPKQYKGIRIHNPGRAGSGSTTKGRARLNCGLIYIEWAYPTQLFDMQIQRSTMHSLRQ